MQLYVKRHQKTHQKKASRYMFGKRDLPSISKVDVVIVVATIVINNSSNLYMLFLFSKRRRSQAQRYDMNLK